MKQLIKQPIFNGKGNHSVNDLEAICEQYQLYCNQLLSCQEQSKESDAIEFAEWLSDQGFKRHFDEWYYLSFNNGNFKTTTELYNLFKTTPLKG